MGIALRKSRGKTVDEFPMSRVWKIVAAPKAKNKNPCVTLAGFQLAEAYPEAASRHRRVCAKHLPQQTESTSQKRPAPQDVFCNTQHAASSSSGVSVAQRQPNTLIRT